MSEPAERFEIHWASPARRALRRPPEKVATAAVEFIYGALADNPHRVGRPLRFELEGRHSAHRGDYRVVYRIDERRGQVDILAIDQRRPVRTGYVGAITAHPREAASDLCE